MNSPTIQKRVMQFIGQRFGTGSMGDNVQKVRGGLSTRQYYRYVAGSGDSFILTGYPESFEPEPFPYLQIHRLFQEIGVKVPEIIQLDGELGIVLLQDLGDESLQMRLKHAPVPQKVEMLQQAIDNLLEIQKGSFHFNENFTNYSLTLNEQELQRQLRFFLRSYLQQYRGLEVDDPGQLQKEFSQLAAELGAGPRTLCHRDYHPRNLIVFENHLYVIDFQDAGWGPISYDLVTLLRDFIDLMPREADDLVAYYLDSAHATLSPKFPVLAEALKPSRFIRQFHLVLIQRLLRGLGTCAYQIRHRKNRMDDPSVAGSFIAASLHRTLLSLQALGEFPYIQSLIEDERK